MPSRWVAIRSNVRALQHRGISADYFDVVLCFVFGVLQLLVPTIVCLLERGKADERFDGDKLIYRS